MTTIIKKFQKKYGRKKYIYNFGLKKKVNKALRLANRNAPEKKWIDTGFNQICDTTVSVFTPLTIPQGDGHAGRNGDEVRLESLDLRFHTIWDGSGNTQLMRCLIVQTKYENGQIPVISNLLQYTSAQTSFTQWIVSPYQHDFRDSFKVLYDKTITVSALDRSAVGHTYKRINLKHSKCQYLSSTTQSYNGGIFALFVGDATNSSTGPIVNGIIRLNYTDA